MEDQGNGENEVVRNRPEKVYRYRPLSNEKEWGYLERIIVESRMFAASRLCVNDPDDCTVRISWDASPEEFAARYWEGYKRDYPNIPEPHLQMYFEQWHRNLTTPGSMEQAKENVQLSVNGYGIICFSPSSEMTNQWERYATSSRGVCLVFEVRADTNFREKLVPVCYVDELPVASVFRDSSAVQVGKCLYTKTSKWASEEEWRALFPGLACTEVAFAPEALIEIVLGSEMPGESEQRIRAMVDRRGLPVKISRSTHKAAERRPFDD